MSDKADYTELYLPDGDLDETSRGFAQQIRAFADDKLAPHAREIDETCTFRREMVDDLGRAGVLGGPLPTVVRCLGAMALGYAFMATAFDPLLLGWGWNITRCRMASAVDVQPAAARVRSRRAVPRPRAPHPVHRAISCHFCSGEVPSPWCTGVCGDNAVSVPDGTISGYPGGGVRG